jgi:spore germination protein KA
MIPTLLLDSIAKYRENVPFPTIVEVLIMEISFELIREGGIRIPSITGQTLGIIGALILGQAAVAAGLVSPILIIVVSITGLGSFTIPNYGLSVGVRILRFIFIFFASIAGFYGIILGAFIIGGLMVNIKSFGVPFYSPIAPTVRKNPDLFLRLPLWKQEYRPDQLQTKKKRKQPKISRPWKFKGGPGND